MTAEKSETIPRAAVLEIYALFDKLATTINCATGDLVFGGGLKKVFADLNKADRLSDEIETCFARILTDEERGIDTRL